MMPDTSYAFLLRVYDLEDGLFSDIIATTGKTKGQLILHTP